MIKPKKVKRNYKDDEILRLVVAAGGRCHLCNNDIMNDWRSGEPISTLEKAHIYALSVNGPRPNIEMTEAERNDVENILTLCSSCHDTIDDSIGAGIYTVQMLKKIKKEKQKKIHRVLDVFDDENCLFIKYNGVIDTQNSYFTDKAIKKVCFENGFYSKEEPIDLGEDANTEDIDRSIRTIDDAFFNRVQRIIDGGQERTICLFARAPQPTLIYLGAMFNDKHNVVVFTLHRNMAWRYNDISMCNSFVLRQPMKHKNNKVALVLGVTANPADERIIKLLGADVDIWRISAERMGIDVIGNQSDLERFYKICVEAFDTIGEYYGKNAVIHVFPAICNSLAITLGRARFTKSHNKLYIYDAIKKDGVYTDELKLKIG